MAGVMSMSAAWTHAGAVQLPDLSELPPLRQELALHRGPRLRDGQPSWTLHDPVRNQFFQLDWLSFEILAHWHLGKAEQIADVIVEQTTLQAVAEDVTVLLEFLQRNELIHQPGANQSTAMARRASAGKHGAMRWLLHNYLFFRVPLMRPDALLTWLLGRLSFIFGAGFACVTALALLVGSALVYRHWEQFHHTLVDTISPSGLFNYAMTLVLVKLLHEFGHGLVAKRYGCRVPTMGLAFMVLWPIPYTDTNEAWKLADRWQRLQIAAAGVATELVVACWATLAWGLLPDGDLRSAAFLLATTTWVSTLLINCSPLMRFDGYFVLSDFLEMPNLHARAFALARWRLREVFFNMGAEPPEIFTPWRARGLQLFAYLVWVYRLLLFLGIAVLVYSFFIKLVGILLFIVEILWFVMMPIAAEIKVWRQLWPTIKRRRRTWFSAVLMLAVLGLTALPLPGHINAAGLLQTSQAQLIYAPAAGRIERLHVADGELVQVGQKLLSFSTEQVEQQLQSARSRIQRYSAEADAGAMRSELRAGLQVAQAKLSTAQASRRGLEARLNELAPTAPGEGLMRWRDPDLRAGDWVAAREPIAVLLTPRAWQVETYISESEIARISMGSKAHFYLDGRFGEPVSLTVTSISHDASHVLPQSTLATMMGGTVVVREVDGRLLPEHAIYRVSLQATTQPHALEGQTWRGRVVVEAAPKSLLERFVEVALALWWREAGW